ncbi:MAG TPA: TRAP transporter small permease subunit, partial [Hyphomicrobiaceae bacterium]|nr:TRAP transporter small permease subunit [Hyphomicrobiaceae bacterium]
MAAQGALGTGGTGPEVSISRTERAFDIFYRALGWLAGLILAIMALSVFMSVVMRWLGSQAIEGLDEIPRYLFVWLVAIGGAAAMHRGEHTVLDYFVN